MLVSHTLLSPLDTHPKYYFPQAKKFVESLPQVLKEDPPKDKAEKMQKTFEALGAVVKLN